MKRIVFTEFLDVVEEQFGYEVVDKILIENQERLNSGGSYTAIGTYDHQKMVYLVNSLSQHSGIDSQKLLKIFARALFDTLSSSYPQFMNAADNAFDFLESIEKYIHVEVKKLYPDAELPQFQTRRLNDHTLEMIYISERKMGAIAEGLIEKALLYYDETADIETAPLNAEGSKVKFILTKK